VSAILPETENERLPFMKRILLATVATLALAAPAMADTAIDDAIAALYAANNTVQIAIEGDVCHDPQDYDALPFLDSNDFRAMLSGPDLASYDTVRDALGVAYDGTEGTDGDLEAVQAAFCEAVFDR
jgi:hypothetical protein